MSGLDIANQRMVPHLASRVARLVLAHRALFAAVWLVSSGWLALQAATQLPLQPGIERMVDDGSARPGAPRGPMAPSEIAVLIQGPVWTGGFLAELGQLQQELEGLPRGDGLLFDRSLSLLTAPRLSMQGDTLSGGQLSDLLALGPSRLREAIRGDPAVAGKLVDQKGEVALILLLGPRLDDSEVVEATDAVSALAARHDRDDFRVSVAGLPLLKALIANLLYHDIGWLFGLSVLAALAVLVLTFRSASGVAGPALVIGATTAWTFGAMAVLGTPLTIVGLYLPAVLTVVSIGDAIHLQQLYRSRRAQGQGSHEAIVQACSAAALPMFYTTATTCVGLLGLCAAHIQAIVDLGAFGAFGIAAAYVHTLVLIPIALSFERRAPVPERARSGWLDRLLRRISGLPTRGGRSDAYILGAALVIALASAIGMSRLRVHHEVVEWLPKNNSLTPAISLLDTRLGGSAPATLRIGLPEGASIRQQPTLQRLAAVEQALLGYRDPASGRALVRSATSALDVVRTAWRALRQPDQEGPLPTDQDTTDAVFQFLDLAAVRELSAFEHAHGRSTQIDLRLTWVDAGTYGGLIEAAETVASAQFGPGTAARVEGPVADMNRATNALLGDLMRSFFVSCAGVSLALIMCVGGLRLGLLAMVPNLLPIGIVLGVMGLLNIPLDVHTMLLSSVLLGIVVDDTIHLLHHYRVNLSQGRSVQESVAASIQTAGRALVVTSLTLALGFLTCFASSLRHMQRMAGLLALAIVVALVVDLLLTPVLLRRYR